jgi:hypothetical protein
MLSSLDIYTSLLERHLLDATDMFYATEAKTLAHELDVLH